jgi:hypothetical protein
MRYQRLLKGVLCVVVVLVMGWGRPQTAQANFESDPCPNPQGAYYTVLAPYFNTAKGEIALIDPRTNEVVQVLAEGVKHMNYLYFSYDRGWSPSCRYFGFAIQQTKGTDTILWDTQARKQVGLFHLPGVFDPPYLDWSPDEAYLVAGNYLGDYLWTIATNTQAHLNDMPTWYYSAPSTWDIPHGQILMFDGSYLVAYALSTGKALHKFPSPFQGNVTHYELSADGHTLRFWDQDVDHWSVTFDRASGAVIDAYAEPGLKPSDVQFSPDRHYLVIGGGTIDVFDVTAATSSFDDSWYPNFSLAGGYLTWKFYDANTLELDFTRTGQRQLIDLKTGHVR